MPTGPPREVQQETPNSKLLLMGILGATEAEIPALAELHRNPHLHLIGIYDSDPMAMGLELAEILGIPSGSGQSFLAHLSTAQVIILPRDRHRFEREINALRDAGVELVDVDSALASYPAERIRDAVRPAAIAAEAEEGAKRLEEALRWLNRALDREELLRAMLTIGISAVGASKGSIQILDPMTHELFIGYAEGLSDQVVRTSRIKIGEGISGSVAASKRGRLMHGRLHRHLLPAREELLSSISVPLLVQNEVLGVLNVSTELGSRPLNASDLQQLTQLGDRMAPILARLLEIQAEHERSVIDDLQNELESLLRLELEPIESLSVMRELLQDVAGTESAQLMVLTSDGPAINVRARDEQGRPRVERELDPHAGMLGQVILSREPVILEERIRLAGETQVRRHLTLYLPIGHPETFALFVAHFDSLAMLSHFQRSLESVQRVLTPRLAEVLIREERRSRMERLRLLVHGLSAISMQGQRERPAFAAEVLRRQSDASAVAIWNDAGSDPHVVVNEGLEDSEELRALWPRLRERLSKNDRQRLRELDEHGSSLRSVLLVGRNDGPALVAINRRPRSPLEEIGFREEDEEAALAILQALGIEEDATPGSQQAKTAREPASEFERNRQVLVESTQRELERAQRYHFGFSVTMFDLGLDPSQWSRHSEHLRHALAAATRTTDCVLWVGPGRFAILAPEEARGQRRLARRLEETLQDRMRQLGAEGAGTQVVSASYPQDGEEAAGLLAHVEGQLRPPAH